MCNNSIILSYVMLICNKALAQLLYKQYEKYSTRGHAKRQIQHKVKLSAVFVSSCSQVPYRTNIRECFLFSLSYLVYSNPEFPFAVSYQPAIRGIAMNQSH